MEAMILAAGLGTRLRPLTDGVPKALVEVGGRPLLAHVLDRLVEAGASRIVVNTHRHADQIRRFFREHPPGVSGSTRTPVDIAFSPEPDGPYDTGGGLFAAQDLFRREEAFLLHNTDILSDIDLGGLVQQHRTAAEGYGHALMASLAVQDREGSRKLLFDDMGLIGWENRGSDRSPNGLHMVRQPVGDLRRLAFTGIHVVEPRIFASTNRTGTFSIITLYLELAAQGKLIRPLDVTGARWMDVGTAERLEEAQRFFEAEC